jgi:hypothetical protein
MDFAAVLKPVSFARQPPGSLPSDIPTPLRLRHRPNRRIVALQECRGILSELPQPGEALHVIQTGRYDLTDLLDVLIERLGTITHLRIATLSFNQRNIERLRAWTEAGSVLRLTLLCSQFFAFHFGDLWDSVRALFPPPHALAAVRNHCKVITLDLKSGPLFTLEGSANLRTNSNQENFVLIHDAELTQWHADWIDSRVSEHQG